MLRLYTILLLVFCSLTLYSQSSGAHDQAFLEALESEDLLSLKSLLQGMGEKDLDYLVQKYDPLHNAYGAGDRGRVKLLLEAGFPHLGPIGHYDSVVSLLFRAVSEGDIRTASLALENGGRLYATGELKDYQDELTLAIESNSLPMAKLLLDHGADVNRRSLQLSNGEPSGGGHYPIFSGLRRIEMMMLLVTHGAEVNLMKYDFFYSDATFTSLLDQAEKHLNSLWAAGDITQIRSGYFIRQILLNRGGAVCGGPADGLRF
jgi:hypothetical protein